jgi:hypothetical protein
VSTDLKITLVGIVVAIATAAGCGWMGARPRDYTKPRMVPWQLLMLTLAVVVMILGVHLLTLFGVNTATR